MACFVQLFCSVHMLVRYVTVCSSDIKKLLKCRNNNKLFGHKYTHVSVHAHCQSSTMIVHCFLYAFISIQLLLLSGDVETNPGPVTKVCPACSRSVHIRKTVCDCGNVFVSKKCTFVCPKCSTSVNIKMATCSTCGYVFNNDKPCPIRESKRLGMQRKRALESETETFERRSKNQKLMSNKRASESDIETAARRAKNRNFMSNKRASESDIETAARRAKNQKLMSNKRASESDIETAARRAKNQKLMSNKRASESDIETAARRAKNQKLMSNKRASESDIESAARRQADRVAKAGRRASESSDQASQRREKDKTQKLNRLKATVAIDHAINAFHFKIKQGPEFVCTCCHRMMYKQNVISCNVDKYNKCSAEVLQNVFDKESSYTCSSGKQWVCKTCDSALTRGNIPVQAKANGFKLPSIPPEFSSLNSLEVRLISLRVPFMKMVALPSGKQRCIHGPAVNVPSKLDSVCELLPRLPSETELVPFKLKRKLAYKGHYMYDYVRPDKVMSALRWLKANNPLYKDVTINEGWVSDSLAADSELFTGLTEPTEESMDTNNTCTGTEESMETACAQPQSANNVLSSITSRNGFTIHDVPDDGNCLFSAIAYQLPSIGIRGIDTNTLRTMVW